MEKQVYGKPQSAVGSISAQTWLDQVVSETYLTHSKNVKVTFGKSKGTTIQDIAAVYVFTPEKARGENGVILKEFLGIGNVRELLLQFVGISHSQPLALFPICIPKYGNSELHNQLSTMMVGGIWMKYRTIQPEQKWTLLALFNVLQFFLYNASTNHADRSFFLEQFIYLFQQTASKLLIDEPQLLQYVLGAASDLKSDDVLHTITSLLFVQGHMPQMYAKINLKMLIMTLMKTTLRRQVKFKNISASADLSKSTALDCFFNFVPLVQKLIAGELNVDQTLETMKKIKISNQTKQKSAKPGLDHFKVVMESADWGIKFTSKDIEEIWCQGVVSSTDLQIPEMSKIEFKQPSKLSFKNQVKSSNQNNSSIKSKDQPKSAKPLKDENGIKWDDWSNMQQVKWLASKGKEEKNQSTISSSTTDECESQSSKKDSYIRPPFKFISREASYKIEKSFIDCIFPAKFALVVLPSEGHYTFTLQSTLNSNFFGKNTYMKDNALVSQCRVLQAQKKGERHFQKDLDQDSYSIGGVWYQGNSRKYVQKAPVVHRSTQQVEFEVIFFKGNVYIIQGTKLFQKLSYKQITYNSKGEKDFSEWNFQSKSKSTQYKEILLGIQAQNCTAEIRRQNIDTDLIEDLICQQQSYQCSICYEVIEEGKALECEHHFCDKCISEWVSRKNTCPVCRREV